MTVQYYCHSISSYKIEQLLVTPIYIRWCVSMQPHKVSIYGHVTRQLPNMYMYTYTYILYIHNIIYIEAADVHLTCMRYVYILRGDKLTL